jgi:streptogramin lyase
MTRIKSFISLILILIITVFSVSFSQEWSVYLARKQINCLANEGEYIWVGTAGGLVKLNKSTGEFIVYDKWNTKLPGNYVTAIAIDEQRNKWIGTWGGGLAKFDGVNWTVYNTSNSGLPDNYVYAIAIDEQGNKWIGTNGGGLARFDGVNWTVYNTSNSGLPFDNVSVIMINKDGNKWIGTDGGGLVKFDGVNWTVYNTSNSGLPHNSVWAIAIDEQRNKWIGTRAGIVKFDGVNWIVYKTSSGLPDNWVRSIAIDEQGNKWIGTLGGLAKFDGVNWTVYNTSNSRLPDNYVRAIAIDGQGNKWIGTSGGLALFHESGIIISEKEKPTPKPKEPEKTEEKDTKKTLPPVITIISPRDGSYFTNTELTVQYAIKNPSGEPITKIRVLIDGKLLPQERGIMLKQIDEETGEITITAPQRDFELSLIAETKYSISAPSTVKLYWRGDAFVIKPKLYILAIGVSKYKDKDLQLRFASKDATDFVEIMKLQKGLLFEDVIVKLLVDEQATKDNILDGLDWLERQTTSKDVAILFLAGHGLNDRANNFYFLPVDVDIEHLKRTGVAFSDIKNTVSAISGKSIVFVDACHSGNVFGGKRAVVDMTSIVNELTSAESGVVVFASSTGKQFSFEDPAWGNGAFTKALIEGLKGKADLLGKGKITINMLQAYISERVKELTKGKQTPTVVKPQSVPDFPIAVVIQK